MKTINQFLFFAILIFTITACGNEPQPIEPNSTLVEITNQQFVGDSMQMGKTTSRIFNNTIKCSGLIVPLPNGIALVNASLSGIIKNIYCQNGQFVEKNQPLLEISGNELIDIQKDYAEAYAKFKKMKNEYERISSLFNEKVTSEKEFNIIESDYNSSKAIYNGLKLKIETLGFSTSKIENGEFYSSYMLKSPINGYVSRLKATKGSFIDTHSEIIEVVDPKLFQVKLSVFANDIENLKMGQTVRFKSINSKNLQFAILSSIGIAIDNETKSIECFATIDDKNLINSKANEFVESEILTTTDTVDALPSEAIIKDETGFYILVLKKQETTKYFFEKVEVEIGRQNGGFTEIIGNKIEGMVLTNGVYNITVL